jgi:integrase
MAQNTVLLTKRVIDAARPEEARYDIWDSEIAGFGLRVGVGGTKTFVLRYRAENGGRGAPKRHITIGRFGPLTVELARRQARQLLAQATVGEDPAKARNDKRAEMRISDLIDLYEEEGCFIQRGKHQGAPMKPLTKQYTIARLRHHVLPLLGRHRITEIGATEIERFFRDVENGKTAKNEMIGPRKRIIVKGGSGAARKVFRDLSAVFSFARRREMVDRNPCDTASVRKTDNHKDRYLTLAEVKRFGDALRELENEGVNRKALDIMRLWMLTGCRREEIASLRWKEVDFDHGSLRFEDSKTGRNVRPIGAAAVAVLNTVERCEDSDFVFPAEDGDGYFRGYKTPWKKAVNKADLTDVTPHTLRHTMGSTAISSGEAMAFTGAILGHSNPRSTAIYAHVQHNPARQAADRVAEKIAAALAGMSDAEVDAPSADEDEDLLRRVAATLMKGGAEAERLRVVVNALAI